MDEIQARLQNPEATVANRCAISVSIRLWICFRATRPASDLKEWLKDANINHDRNRRRQRLAGLGLNLYESGPIYSEILRYRKFPGNLFVGQPATIQSLRAGIQRGLDFRE